MPLRERLNTFLAGHVEPKETHCTEVHHLHRQRTARGLQNLGEYKLAEGAGMFFKHEAGAVHFFELLQERSGIEVKSTPIEEGTLLSTLGVCGCRLSIQPYVLLLGARE